MLNGMIAMQSLNLHLLSHSYNSLQNIIFRIRPNSKKAKDILTQQDINRVGFYFITNQG